MTQPAIIWLASYPRSGNTMLRTILWHCFGLRSASIYPQDLGGNTELENHVGHIEHDAGGEITFPSHGLPLVKTHGYPPDSNPGIYVVRDGRAACASIYHFYKKEISLEKIITGQLKFGTWQNHVKAWHPWDRPTTLLLKYKDMVTNLPLILTQISHFTGRDIITSTIPDRDDMAKIDGQFVRKKSRWQEVISGDLLALFDEHNGTMLKNMGYLPY